MPLTCSAIVLAALAAASAGAASPDGGQPDSERARIDAYLAAHDTPSAADLRGISPAPDQALMAIALDAQAERLTRARAVAALRLLPSATVQSFLAKLIRNKAKTTDATERLLLRRAAVVLGFLAGSDAPNHLALLFQNDDADVRLDAVLGIAMSRAETAGEVLRSQLAVETTPRVRNLILRQLTVLGEAPSEPDKAKVRKKPQREPMRGGF